MITNWKKLIERYKNDRQVCNCGEAYLTPCGTAYVDGVKIDNYPACQYGCDAAQREAREYVASQVVKELR